MAQIFILRRQGLKLGVQRLELLLQHVNLAPGGTQLGAHGEQLIQKQIRHFVEQLFDQLEVRRRVNMVAERITQQQPALGVGVGIKRHNGGDAVAPH